MNIPFENLEKINTIIDKLNSLEQKISVEKRWLNVSETAKYLGYSKDHIHKLKNEYFFEGVHFYKKAGRILFDKIELDKWVTTYETKEDVKEIVNHVLKEVL
ncbi:DNA-binding protein [Campylobacterota bacterium DY0563]